MVWTNVNKPTTPTYTNVNPMGREQYDQADIEYDDTDIFYDGINPAMWTNVVKPSYSLTWDDLPVSWQSYNSPWGGPTWTNVNKPQ